MNRKQFFTLVATIIGSGVVILDGTVVNLALPNIAHNLHATFADLQWIVDGYLLTLSALMLLGGSLGDIFGRKRAYMLGLGGFGVISLLCGLAPNVATLIGLRMVQGAFGALLVPGGLAIINTNFQREIRGAAIGRWSAWSALAAALGPLIGGYLVDVASWRWIFFINVPLVAVCWVLAWVGVTESHDARRRIDALGAGLAALGLAGLTYGLIEGPAHHWRGMALAALIAGLALFAIFLFTERGKKDPMVRLALFRSRNFSGANAATFAMYGGLSGFIFALVIHLQTALGYSALAAGVSLFPISVAMLTLAGRFGALAGKYGPRLFMTLGPLIQAGGIAWLYFVHHGSSYLFGVLPGVVIFAFGLAVTVAPLTTTVMTSVDEADSGIASGINNAVSRVAGLVVVAVLGILGSARIYHFSIALSASLAAVAGVLSWLLVQNPKPTGVSGKTKLVNKGKV